MQQNSGGASAGDFTSPKNTIRNTACIRAGNKGAACNDGGAYPDPGAQGGLTACGNNALDTGIIGIHKEIFGQQTGRPGPTNLCGKRVQITNPANGKSVIGIVMDRISQNQGPQVDLSTELNKGLGGNGKDNIIGPLKVKFL